MTESECLLTLDMDWAPDFAIQRVAKVLIERQVRATWFVTHRCASLEALAARPDLFELGIHPNFAPGSSQGATPDDVLVSCLAVVPEARSLRTHGLMQSTKLLDTVIRRTRLENDVSLFLPRTPALRPVAYPWAGRTLCRIPFFWEDDFEMVGPQPDWRLSPLLALGEGVKVFNFHPIHVALNSSSPEAYEQLKRTRPYMQEVTPRDLAPCVRRGPGAATLFAELVDHLARSGGGRRIQDVAAAWRSGAAGGGGDPTAPAATRSPS